MGVLGGWAFSYERGATVPEAPRPEIRNYGLLVGINRVSDERFNKERGGYIGSYQHGTNLVGATVGGNRSVSGVGQTLSLSLSLSFSSLSLLYMYMYIYMCTYIYIHIYIYIYLTSTRVGVECSRSAVA